MTERTAMTFETRDAATRRWRRQRRRRLTSGPCSASSIFMRRTWRSPLSRIIQGQRLLPDEGGAVLVGSVAQRRLGRPPNRSPTGVTWPRKFWRRVRPRR